ncbi:hypothetical protein BKA60DRAFT_635177 [Fusarium oxysporum]|uniref:Uncharacterized protein n=1 Tax=Fusarium oxysporum TaxID=5507 RepID=A0A420NC71_FUSOX|nr:hypothetical protein BKA60DRAFT_635177 [Fusarium oxysporum]RKK77879.1 hypothetical protein BFJ69_g5876 [Fusarium oxysporum]
MSTPPPTLTPSSAIDLEMENEHWWNAFEPLREILDLAKQTEQNPDSSGESPEDETLWGSPPSPPPSPNVSVNMTLAFPVPVPSEVLEPAIPEESNLVPQDQLPMGKEGQVTGLASDIGPSPVITEGTKPQTPDPQFAFDADVTANDALKCVTPELNEASRPKKSRAAAKGKPKRSPKRVAKPPKRLSAHKEAQQRDKVALQEALQKARERDVREAAEKAAAEMVAEMAAALRTEQSTSAFMPQAPFHGADGQLYGQNLFQTPAPSLYTQAVPFYQPPPQVPTQSTDHELFGQSLPAAQYSFAAPSQSFVVPPQSFAMPQHQYQLY